MSKHSHKNLLEIHEDVPAEHYDLGIKKNLFQRLWHTSRFKQVKRVIKSVNGPFLDMGCHSGTFTAQVMKKINSDQVYGIDISHSAIELAKKRFPKGHFQMADAHNLPFKDNFFEAVFCLEMLEHVDDPVKVLTEMRRVMKNQAYSVLLVPSENKLFKIVWFLWTMYYPVWRHAHVQSFQKSELEKILKKLKFKVVMSKTFNLGMLKLVVCEKV